MSSCRWPLKFQPAVQEDSLCATTSPPPAPTAAASPAGHYIGSAGGLRGCDGAPNNNDFIVFIDQFFAGC
ncbi:MAG TPA: hypothetical protein VEB22_15110 [Phycisphaerales bacterium]|nr:hypothetical protein [Phycisphaerales bacterium]